MTSLPGDIVFGRFSIAVVVVVVATLAWYCTAELGYNIMKGTEYFVSL
jgi:hypothetical protein